MKRIDPIFDILEIKPKNKKLYIQALTHSTFANENKNYESYDKLEFLGDSILQFISTEYIFDNYPEINEGTMSNLRAKNVSAGPLSLLTKKLGLNKYLIYSNDEKLKENEKICSDIFESIVAAIYKDLGMDEVKKFLDKHLLKKIKSTLISEENLKDPKTRLQEKLQPCFKKPVKYKTFNISDSEWRAEATIDNIIYGVGVGKTKYDAEISAAENALKKHKEK